MEPIITTPDIRRDMDDPYILFTVGKNTYAISSEFAQGIEILNEATPIPRVAPGISSGTFYRDEFIHLINLRELFGMGTRVEEFEKMVQPEQRIRDHENWISELEKSIHENREFTLTEDPHKCAFGKWYYSFKTDNQVLKHQLGAIETPHETIHNTAKYVKELMRRGEQKLAIEAVKELRETHYKTTVDILLSLRRIVEENLREMYVVVKMDDQIQGVMVDTIVGVEYLESIMEVPPVSGGSKYVKWISQRKKDDRIVMVLDNAIIE